jgi:hypothetical protein
MNNYEDTTIVELAAIVANHLQQKDIHVVLVGGLAVELYTENLYLTKDIDMVDTSYQPPSTIRQAMSEIGFSKKGRVYVNETTEICVEFPSGPLSVGEQLILETTVVKTERGEIPILHARDVIKDRLAAYFHWNDKPSLVQALAVMINHSIQTDELKAFCVGEGEQAQIEVIEKLWNSIKRQRLHTMKEIEAQVIEQIMTDL